MSSLLLSALVHVAQADEAVFGPEPVSEEFGASRDGGSSSGGKKKNKDKGKDSSDEKNTFQKGKIWGWHYRPYVTPGGGLTIGGGGTAITGAVDVGARYWKEKWRGDLQLGGSYTTGSALDGYDVHLGNEFGRREEWWGVTLGGLLFYNTYSSGNKTLDPALGLDVPLEVTLGPKKYYLFGGVTPSFIFNEDRHVKGLPFGDEFEWQVGAGLHLKWITAQVAYTSRITTIGTINTPTISVSIAGAD